MAAALPRSPTTVKKTAFKITRAGQLVADGQGVLLLFNANGQVVRQQFVSNQRAEMNLNDLPRGLYIAKLGNRTVKILH